MLAIPGAETPLKRSGACLPAFQFQLRVAGPQVQRRQLVDFSGAAKHLAAAAIVVAVIGACAYTDSFWPIGALLLIQVLVGEA